MILEFDFDMERSSNGLDIPPQRIELYTIEFTTFDIRYPVLPNVQLVRDVVLRELTCPAQASRNCRSTRYRKLRVVCRSLTQFE